MTIGSGGTGDRITVAGINNIGADNQAGLIVGTWYPTTLTATRAYWGAGNNAVRAVVDATTSEIRMHSVNATTSGQWLTSGAGIVVNQWHFIAWMYAFENTGPAGAWRVWVGTENNLPTELTVTNPTAPAGNYTGATNFTIGNAGTGSVAFQGDVGWASVINHASAPNIDTLVPVGASGAISDAEAAHVLQRWVIPLYLGRPNLAHGASVFVNSWQIFHCPLRQLASAVFTWFNGGGSFSAPAFGGTIVVSANQPFVNPPENWPALHPYVRR